MAGDDNKAAASGGTVVKRTPLLGGPGTILPFVAESFMSWSLCLSCLSVSGYHYVRTTIVIPALTRLRLLWSSESNHSAQKDLPYFRCWLPLTIASRAELERATPSERYHQLGTALVSFIGKEEYTDEELLTALRSHEACRRLASLAMRPYAKESDSTAKQSVLTTLAAEHLQNPQSDDNNPLVLRLAKLWPQVLKLPPPEPFDGSKSPLISMIMPCYHELGQDVHKKLSRALKECHNPACVEVLVVNAGGCTNLEMLTDHSHRWKSLQILDFTKRGGGRGPCLNFGAANATGQVYMFSHSDTTLPSQWDVKVLQALSPTQPSSIRPNSCAFSFGIDTTPFGLNGGPLPPGIKAVETTANWRTQLYSLPYGDQVLSVPAVVFDYVGGFPDQCLMEDYELVALLRKRVALLPKLGLNTERERLVIVPDPPALCSPRRWQAFGVLYVTYMNSMYVNAYAGGESPDQLFRRYYGKDPPARQDQLAPWEVEHSKLWQR